MSVLAALSRTVEKRDLGTYGHSMRVSAISLLIAENLGLSAPEIEDVRAASLLHNIGKIGISDSILGKQGRLTREETEPAPKIGTRLRTEFIKGMGRQNDRFSIILDMDKVFSLDEFALVQAGRAETEA